MSDKVELSDVMGALKESNKAFEAYKSANDDIIKEINEKGQADPLLDEKLVKINETLTANQKTLDDFHLAMKRKNLSKDGIDADELDVKAHVWASMVAKKRGEVVQDFTNENLDAYKSVLDKFMRKGNDVLELDERKALSVGSDPDGGYVVHPDTSGQIVTRVFETSPMRQYAAI